MKAKVILIFAGYWEKIGQNTQALIKDYFS